MYVSLELLSSRSIKARRFIKRRQKIVFKIERRFAWNLLIHLDEVLGDGRTDARQMILRKEFDQRFQRCDTETCVLKSIFSATSISVFFIFDRLPFFDFRPLFHLSIFSSFFPFSILSQIQNRFKKRRKKNKSVNIETEEIHPCILFHTVGDLDLRYNKIYTSKLIRIMIWIL